MEYEINKVLFIINKFSGTGYQSQLEGRILDACRDANVECTIEFTQGPRHATELARSGTREDFNLIVAVGGDGTMNEVAQGLVNSPVAMGIIPRGSGNGLARHLGTPLHVEKAAQMLFQSVPVNIDTFTINNKLSLNVSGIGFDGQVAKQFATRGKRGLVTYAKVALEEYSKFKEFDAHITVAGKELERKSFIIALANSSQYGNNVKVAPLASICDQKLHISILKKVPAYRMDFIYSFLKGEVNKSTFCETIETDKINIKLAKPIAYHVDGEPCDEEDHFTIEIQPASLSMMVPKKNINRV